MVNSEGLGVVTLLLLVFFVAGVEQQLWAQSYGYKRKEDPLVKGVKAAIILARDGKKQELEKEILRLDWQVAELKREVDIGVDLGPIIDKAVKTEESQRIAYALTHLVFQACRQKFHWNVSEELTRSVRARTRLDAAQFYYEEILSHAIRRADKAQKKERHRKILSAFRKMRSTLGSAGLFGAGKRAPDVVEFRRLSADVEKLMREVYRDFLGAPPKSRTDGEKKSKGRDAHEGEKKE